MRVTNLFNLLPIVLLSFSAWSADQDIVINEIMYHPHVDCSYTEFIELTNKGDQPVDLGGWFVSDGVLLTLPDEVILEPGDYCLFVRDPEAFRQEYPDVEAPIIGPYERKLSNSGERLAIMNREREIIDEFTWDDAYPWPVAADGMGASLELIHPSLDNSQPGYWRPAEGVRYVDETPYIRFDRLDTHATPGQRNSVYSEEIPPNLQDIRHDPHAPESGEEVFVAATIEHPSQLDSIILQYQIVHPGHYIRLTDKEYSTNWTDISMHDSGEFPDAHANDGIFTASIPAQDHRDLVRYKITALNKNGASVTAPHPTDPSPNFAYFVYDGVPPYRVTKPEERIHTQLTEVPVYHLLADADDIRECENVQTNKTTRNYFQWYGTFYYNGEVYDHIRYRLRGGVWRYTFNKRMWKIRLNKGAYFRGHNNDGTPYDPPRRTLNLNSLSQNMQINDPHRGELGLFETAGFWLFGRVGCGTFDTTWVHYRIIDDESEEGEDQFSGDFYGLYLNIEQADDRYIENHDYPENSSLYKMHRGWTGTDKIWEKETNNCDPPDDSDLVEFYQGYNRRDGDQYLQQHLNIEKYLSYRCIVEAIHHYDIYAEKNYYYLRNGANNLWEVIPWDLDITFGSDHGDGNEPFRDKLIGNLAANPNVDKEYTMEFRNRLREVVQLLYNEEVFFPVLDQWKALIDEIAAADLDRWDLYQPPDAPPHKSRYKPLDVRLQEMKDWIKQRIYEDYTDNNNGPKNFVPALVNMAADDQIPHPPSIITPQSQTNFTPANSLRLESSPFEDPNPDDLHMASRWIITREDHFEIQPDWDSRPTQQERTSISVPLQQFEPGYAYRARVKYQDQTGRWSEWSKPVSFVLRKPVSVQEWNIH